MMVCSQRSVLIPVLWIYSGQVLRVPDLRLPALSCVLQGRGSVLCPDSKSVAFPCSFLAGFVWSVMIL